MKFLRLMVLLFVTTSIYPDSLSDLKQARYRKLDEMDYLKQKMYECDFYLRECDEKYEDIVSRSARRVRKNLIEGTCETACQQIEEEIRQMMIGENKQLFEDLYKVALGLGEYSESLFGKVFDSGNPDEVTYFLVDKFMAVTVPFDMVFLMETFLKYEKCMHELIVINKKIFEQEHEHQECIDSLGP